MADRLELSVILDFVKGTDQSNCIKEGEAILRAKRLIRCGVKHQNELVIDLEALCLQSSACNSPPHTITGSLAKESGEWTIKKFFCSCKAGASQTCKHCVAVMLFCHENKINKLEQLSVTDVKCSWNARKAEISRMYLPVPVQDFCHMKAIPQHDYCESKRRKVQQEIGSLFPESAYSVQSKRLLASKDRPDKHLIVEPETVSSFDLNSYLKKIFAETLMPEIQLDAEVNSDVEVNSNAEVNSDAEVNAFFAANVCVSKEQAIDVAMETIDQKSQKWFEEREKRITGSTCYEIFTYTKNKKPDWGKKVNRMLNNDFSGNSATFHGLEYESIARAEYSKFINRPIIECGLIIQPDLPFLGYSPDGLIIDKEIKIFEVKCPILGTTKTAVTVVENLDYLNVENMIYTLKKKHKYYGQVQLGMFLTHTKVCDFIVFCSFDKSFVKVVVHKDEKF